MKVKYIEKLLHGKYKYKVRVYDDSIEKNYKSGLPFSFEVFTQAEEWLEQHNVDYKKRDGNRTTGSIKIRKDGTMDLTDFGVVSGKFYYFNDWAFVEFLEENFKSYITDLEKPYSEDQVEVMEEDTKVRVRKSLYYEKFNWVMRLSWRANREKELVNEFREWMDKIGKIEEVDFKINYIGRPIFYFSNDKDAAMARLRFNDWVDTFEKVITWQEIGDNDV